MFSPGKFLGIEIGGTKLQLVVADEEMRIGQTLRYTINTAGGAAGIHDQISEAVKRIDCLESLIAVGVGFGGPVDWETGTVLVSHQVEGWANFSLAEWLGKITAKPVFIENDANVAALAEATHGSGKGYERVFYITIGSGIGGGMIVDGAIYHGKKPGEAEVGHLRMNKDGVILEEMCSGWAVNKKIRKYITENPNTRLAAMFNASPAPEATFLKPALTENDPAAKVILEETACDLGFALSHVVHLFHPDIIILGGGLSLIGEHLREAVERHLATYIMKAFLPAPIVAIAELGEKTVPIGAAELARKSRVFAKF
jgi:glucokinase